MTPSRPPEQAVVGSSKRARKDTAEAATPVLEELFSLLGELLWSMAGAPAPVGTARGGAGQEGVAPPMVILLGSVEKRGAACILEGAGLRWANDGGRELLRGRPELASTSRVLLATLAEPAAPGGEPRGASREGQRVVRREASLQRIARRAHLVTASWGLTPRQGRVLELVARGLATKEIASELGCTGKTVEVHLGNVFRKLNVNSRAELMAAFWCELEEGG